VTGKNVAWMNVLDVRNTHKGPQFFSSNQPTSVVHNDKKSLWTDKRIIIYNIKTEQKWQTNVICDL